MAPADGTARPTLIQSLRDEPFRYEFFQAVRILERLDRGGQKAVPVGHDGPADAEAVRFAAPLSLSFPSAAISDLKLRRNRGTGVPPVSFAAPEGYLMSVTFLGLTGPSGALPRHYSSMLIERTRDKETAYRDFLDLFNHRLISLFYRAWEKYRFPVSYERAIAHHTAPPEADLFTYSMYSLVGLGTPGLRDRTAVADETFLFFAGLFSHHGRSAEGVCNIVSAYFDVAVSVDQFVGQWLPLAPEERSATPSVANPKGLNCRLGASTILGTRVWDIQSKFRIRLGPLTYAQFCEFLPSGAGFKALFDLVRTYVGPCFDFEIQPVLLAREVPATRLSSDPAVKPRLGQNVWMMTRPFDHDFEEALFAAPDN